MLKDCGLFLSWHISDINFHRYFSWRHLTNFRKRFLQYEYCVFGHQSNRNSQMDKVQRKSTCFSDYFYLSDTIVRVPWHQVRWNRLDLLQWVLQLSVSKHATSIKQHKEYGLRFMLHLNEIDFTKFKFHFQIETTRVISVHAYLKKRIKQHNEKSFRVRNMLCSTWKSAYRWSGHFWIWAVLVLLVPELYWLYERNTFGRICEC